MEHGARTDAIPQAAKPLRFCMVTTFYPPHSFGGDAIFVQHLSNLLARAGHSVDVVHNIDAYRVLAQDAANGEPDDHPGVKVHGLRSSSSLISTLAMHQLGHPALHARQLRALLEQDYDVIHYHNVSLMGAPDVLTYGRAVKLFSMLEYWLVCPTHVLFRFDEKACPQPQCLRCQLSSLRPPQLWRYTNRLPAATKHIDAFLALHQFNIDMHRSRGFCGPMRVLPPFVSRAAGNAIPPGLSTPKYCLFVGRLERLKGAHTLIPLFAGPGSTELWIVGDGSERAALERQAAGNARIRILGKVDRQRLSTLYRNALALIVPSLTYEGFPLVILEALREATPVLVRRIGAMPDIVECAKAGFAYSSADELSAMMNELASRPDVRTAMGRNGLAAFERNWTPEVHLERYLSIVQELTQRRTATGENGGAVQHEDLHARPEIRS